ncbi:MAG TPA: T9SS type A sorting domain-containing protein [Ignavibacteriaceae bacterium]|nr:T9SS type A sorting domain-containing protein [Ignavibacteriaceae bacterium]
MIFKKEIILCFLLILLISNSLIFSQNIGSMAYIQVNEIQLPFNNKGLIADVNINPIGPGGQFAGEMFLFSSGFWLSGYSNDSLWANGVSSSSLIEDYQPGTVGMDPNDPKASIYKLTSSDTPFGQSWQDWIDAVALGADFYDGNGDGVYNPVDLNGNNQWDPNEDKPDLLLDETYWCVYNDGVPSNSRRWVGNPLGIEIRQTIFAEASTGATANTVFVRYRIKNTGLISDTLKDVYFSMWADADVGDPSDDITGCDTIRQGIYFYNNTPDQVYGNQVPSFMMDMLASPPVYIPGVTFIDINGNNIYENGIDTPLDTAVNFLGPLGIRVYPGAKNNGLSSAITSFKNTPGYSDPDNEIQVRNYMVGLTESGLLLNPCTFTYGEVRGGVDCSLVNPLFWFSGDPVTDVGWICNKKGDLRAAGTTGPFTLIKDQEIEILIGYEIANSSTPLEGITAVRAVSDEVQSFYENNFGYTVVSVENEPQVASSFMLEQNYPNPFNPSTKIKYSIPQTDSPLLGGARGGFVTLKVYDILGNEITTLVNEEKQPGVYEVEFNSSIGSRQLANGVYFYRLQAGDYIQTKKMIYLK